MWAIDLEQTYNRSYDDIDGTIFERVVRTYTLCCN